MLAEFFLDYRVVALICVCLLTLKRSRVTSRLPPGPRGLPLLGNILQLGPSKWIQMTEWSKRYGPLYSLNVFGGNIIVVNNHRVAVDLLDKRSAIYSDRPRFIISGEVICGNLAFAFMSHGNQLNKSRKAAREALSRRATENNALMQQRGVISLMESLNRDSKHWSQYVKRQHVSATLSIVYGIPDHEVRDSDIQRIAAFDFALEELVNSWIIIVEAMPWLDCLPTWIARWRLEGRRKHKHISEVFLDFHRNAVKRALEGECDPCVSSFLAENQDLSELEAAWTAGILYVAGNSSVSAAQHVFVLAMLTFPNTMRKAQSQIDEVVGRGRLPNADDGSKLPYIRAIIREILRWRSVAPLGIPHMVNQDDAYEDYFIPKGTTVFYNLWAMNNDPDVYPQPDEFRPERFLDETETNDIIPPYTHGDGHLAFGFGRRTCLGSGVAFETLFLNITTLLWAFDIQRAKDEHGNDIIPDANKFVDQVKVNHPAPFPASFRFRHSDVPEILAHAKADRALPQ